MNKFGDYEEDGLNCDYVDFEDLNVGDKIKISEMPMSQRDLDYMRSVEGVVTRLGESPLYSTIRLTTINETSPEYEEEVGKETPMSFTWGWRTWYVSIQKCYPPMSVRDIIQREYGGIKTPTKKRKRDQGWGKLRKIT